MRRNEKGGTSPVWECVPPFVLWSAVFSHGLMHTARRLLLSGDFDTVFELFRGSLRDETRQIIGIPGLVV